MERRRYSPEPRIRLLEDLLGAMQQKGQVWFARGHEVASYFRRHPHARRSLDLDAASRPNPVPVV